MSVSRPRSLAGILASVLALCALSACAASTPATGASPAQSADPSSASPSASPSAGAPASAGGSTPSAAPPGSASPGPASERVDCKKEKCIALTYDDGPSEYTPKLLEALRRNGGRSTFFLIGGNASEFADTVRAQQRDGMEIANHTSTHPNLAGLSASAVRTELGETQRRIRKITGRNPTLMRPPYGAYSATSNRVSAELGLSVITWDTSPVDWEVHSADKIAKTVLAEARPNQIVLMHDIHPWTVEAAPKIFAGLRQRGYRLVTVSEVLGATKPGKVYPVR